ncbi:MAG: FAD-dependent oxidoreductase [Dehalococcoidales bacterium]|nr:FAD-dependent oxidoreductase [Dehalococcoidales bacterium]
MTYYDLVIVGAGPAGAAAAKAAAERGVKTVLIENQFKSKVDVYPFNGCSDAEIEERLLEMIARGQFKVPS